MESTMELIGIKDVMEMLGVGREMATHILNSPDCPKLPRRKGQKFRVPKGKFVKWWEAGGYEG